MREEGDRGPLEIVVGAAFVGLIIYLLVRRKQQSTVSSQLPVQHPPHVIEKIIERQVIVERCPRCDQLSPVSAGACEHCGAPR